MGHPPRDFIQPNHRNLNKHIRVNNKQMKRNKVNRHLMAVLAGAGIAVTAGAATIVVNTVDNKDFSAGRTNLYLALTLANTNGEAANTIQFDIPGAGPHHIVTPQVVGIAGYAPTGASGYPMITNNNLTIDGYSQPGAQPNSNTILAANNAALRIVIDSRQANYTTDGEHAYATGGTSMDYSLISGANFVSNQQGYDQTTVSQLGIFRATNVVIKGLCFLVDWAPGFNALSVNSISLAVDPTNLVSGVYTGPFTTSIVSPQMGFKVSGCWFNLMPDGVTPVDGGNNAVVTRWHRFSGSNPAGRWTPGGSVVGVGKGAANARADFNIFMSYGNPVSLHGWTNTVAGNFFNVFADGMNQYLPDPQATPGAVDLNFTRTSAYIGGVRDGNATYGTDGDGVNDGEERNIFGGLPRQRATACAAIDQQLGAFNLKIAGNYFGVAVDGTTRFTNSSTFLRLSDRPTPATNVVVGSDFDGVSDGVEGNLLCNNWPLDHWFGSPDFNPGLNGQGQVNWNTPGAVPDVYNPDAQASRSTVSWRGNRMINNLPPYSPSYTSPARAGLAYNWTWVVFNLDANKIADAPEILGSHGISKDKTANDGMINSSNFIPFLDNTLASYCSTRRLKGTFPGGFSGADAANRWTNYLMDIYIANEEGLTNGLKFQTLTNMMPFGWAQGETLVAANVLVDGSDDLNPAANTFAVDISRYNLAPGTKVTCTISYTPYAITNLATATRNGVMTARFAAPVALQASTEIRITSIAQSGGNATISWTGGDGPYVIEKSSSVAPTSWSVVATSSSNSVTVPVDAASAYFRVR